MKHISPLIAGLALLLIVVPAASQPADEADTQLAGETDALRAAWELAPQGLEADIAKMNEQWGAVDAQLADTEHIKIRAGKVSNWSIGQQSLHILKVAQAIGGQVPLLLNAPAAAFGAGSSGGSAAAEGGSPMKEQALAAGFPRGVAQAPRGLGVHYQPDLEECRAALAKTRELWQAVIDRKAELESSTATFPHPVFGPMNAAEWLRFTTVHTSHHLQIMGDILDDHAKRLAAADPESGDAAATSSALDVSSAAPESPDPAPAGPPVYAVALIDIRDRPEYARYEMGFLPVFAKFEGEILAVDENVQPIEGEWSSQRTVILRFPNRAALDRWYNSPEYRKILPHRHASSDANIGIVQGMRSRAE